MLYSFKYISPIGELTLVSNNEKLIAIHIKNICLKEKEKIIDKSTPILIKTKEWLDRYFKGEKPNIKDLEIEFIGSDFQKNVWRLLCEIPYGELTTYGDLAKKICEIMSVSKMSSQAVGNAVGKNPIPIIVPCHRVIGAKGNLTGYSSGLDIKIKLLEHEKVDTTKLYLPRLKKVIV